MKKKFTVIAEIWDNEQGYAATVDATDSDEAIEIVLAEYRAAVVAQQAASGEPIDPEEEDEDDEDSEDGLLRIWAVLEGTPAVVMLRDAD